MASFVYNEFKRASAAAEIDLDADDIRVALMMTNTTVDTENDGIVNLDDFSALDEFDGANYVRKALANEAVAKDDANDRADFSADNVTWTALGAGTRAIAGVLVYYHNTDDASSVPIAWIEFSATPDGNDFTIKWAGGATAGDIVRLT